MNNCVMLIDCYVNFSVCPSQTSSNPCTSSHFHNRNKSALSSALDDSIIALSFVIDLSQLRLPLPVVIIMFVIPVLSFVADSSQLSALYTTTTATTATPTAIDGSTVPSKAFVEPEWEQLRVIPIEFTPSGLLSFPCATYCVCSVAFFFSIRVALKDRQLRKTLKCFWKCVRGSLQRLVVG